MNELVGEGAGEPSASLAERVISARGTEDGLVLRIDGRAPWENIIGEIRAFLGTRRRFLEGGQIAVEWLDRLPTKDQSGELETFLRGEYGIEVVGRRKRPAYTTITLDSKKREKKTAPPVTLAEEEREAPPSSDLPLAEAVDVSASERPTRLEQAMEVFGDADAAYVKRMARFLGEDLPYEEDANAKIVFGTFRSGQRVETPFSLLVVGDVNPGADLIAGGDIIVFGSLRGTAHASAYDDESQERVIVALHMQPMQLRIGSVISRGNDESGHGAEIARIDNRRIVVETFNPRAAVHRRSR